ncbi:MAG: hypothetical protein J7L21_01900 [Sulfurimonas sp.]|nr:hypothetical protein [Sulfurimonas sp.]
MSKKIVRTFTWFDVRNVDSSRWIQIRSFVMRRILACGLKNISVCSNNRYGKFENIITVECFDIDRAIEKYDGMLLDEKFKRFFNSWKIQRRVLLKVKEML